MALETLHITNGDHAVAVLRAAGMHGEIVPWRDVLHEGPVRSDLPLEALSKLRARFIAEAGWAKLGEAEAMFAARDASLRGAARAAEVVLWFEHDLYDQLQLIQVLAWFAVHPHPRVSLVCEAEYLGRMTPARARELFGERRKLVRRDFHVALAAWAAFGSRDPFALQAGDFRAPNLRFLPAALRRLLEEYPWTHDGLSRIERQALFALEDGPQPFDRVFERNAAQEDPIFLGDTVLEWHLKRLRHDALVEGDDTWSITSRGRDVLRGRLDGWAAPRAPRWIGGVELRDGWPRWDAASGRLVDPEHRF
jgi:hypothetical protein